MYAIRSYYVIGIGIHPPSQDKARTVFVAGLQFANGVINTFSELAVGFEALGIVMSVAEVGRFGIVRICVGGQLCVRLYAGKRRQALAVGRLARAFFQGGDLLLWEYSYNFV